MFPFRWCRRDRAAVAAFCWRSDVTSVCFVLATTSCPDGNAGAAGAKAQPPKEQGGRDRSASANQTRDCFETIWEETK
eukprot:5725478-Pleurochrysis_carterae.AAC.1